MPGGTYRNYDSYGHKIGPVNEIQKAILCDPQTSGGLLVALEPKGRLDFLKIARKKGLEIQPFGIIKEKKEPLITILN